MMSVERDGLDLDLQLYFRLCSSNTFAVEVVYNMVA